MKQWLIIAIMMAIIIILIDGFRRMAKARRDSIHMSLTMKTSVSLDENDEHAHNYGSEFPNGGARVSQRQIDKERIERVKSRFDYGREMTMVMDQKRTKAESDPCLSLFHDENEVEKATSDGCEENVDATVTSEPDNDIENEPATTATNPQDDAISTVLANAAETEIETEADRSSSVAPNTEAPAATPQQESFDLDASVPLLMETVDHKVTGLTSRPTEHQPFSVNTESSHQTVPTDNVYHHDSEEGVLMNESPANDSQVVRSSGRYDKPLIEPTISDVSDLDSPTHKFGAPSHGFNGEAQEVLVINVKASTAAGFHGNDLLQEALNNHLRYGAMNIFHRHQQEEGEGPILFSMANMLKPGVFDLKAMDRFSTAGVCFFMTMPVSSNDNLAAFELMLTAAKNTASALHGELKDDQRSVMTAQTIEHYREKIGDFVRRQQLEKQKNS